jgi:hypothetical protein
MPMKKSQKSLKNWTAEKWRTKSGKPSTQGPKATGERYMPARAIASLSSSEYAATTRAKRKATKAGKQVARNTKKAAKATRAARINPGQKRRTRGKR